jgi:hypothetical protein
MDIFAGLTADLLTSLTKSIDTPDWVGYEDEYEDEYEDDVYVHAIRDRLLLLKNRLITGATPDAERLLELQNELVELDDQFRYYGGPLDVSAEEDLFDSLQETIFEVAVDCEDADLLGSLCIAYYSKGWPAPSEAAAAIGMAYDSYQLPRTAWVRATVGIVGA